MIPKMFGALIFFNYEIWNCTILITCFYSPEPKTSTTIFYNMWFLSCQSIFWVPPASHQALAPICVEKVNLLPKTPSYTVSGSPTHSLPPSLASTHSFYSHKNARVTWPLACTASSVCAIIITPCKWGWHITKAGKHTMHKPIAQTKEKDT